MITKEDLYELLEEHSSSSSYWDQDPEDIRDWTDVVLAYDSDLRFDLEGLAAALNRLVADRAKRGISDSNERLQDALEGARMQVREENLDFACDGAEPPRQGKYEDQGGFLNAQSVKCGPVCWTRIAESCNDTREMSLREFVEQLPDYHIARQEWRKLIAEVIGSYEQVDKALSHVEDAASSLKEQAKKHAGY